MSLLVTVGRIVGTPKLPRDVREQQLLDAASHEFGTLGYAGASLSAIADRVGVTKALPIAYFGSKEGLYVACVERAGDALVTAIEAVVTTTLPPMKMAEATLAAMFSTLAHRPHDWNVINDRTVPADGPGAAAGARIRRTIADQARRGVAPMSSIDAVQDEDDLAIVTSIWMGTATAIVDWWLRNPDRTAAEMTERSTRLFAGLTGQA